MTKGKLISGERIIKLGDLDVASMRAASALAAAGVGENDAIATVLRNDFAFFEAAFAAEYLGAYVVPVNWHFREAEIAYILKDSGAKAVIVHDDFFDEVVNAAPDGTLIFYVKTPPEIRAAYPGGPATPPPSHSKNWTDFIAGFNPWTEPPKPARNSIIYTSGTTGQPKGVKRAPATSEIATRMASLVKDALGLSLHKPVNTVITGPIYHAAPNLYALWAVKSRGLTVLQPKFDPKELLFLIEKHRITHLHLVPIMFIRLLKLPEDIRNKFDLSSLEFVSHGAAPCPPEAKKAMIEWWGPIIYEYYGGTETGGAVCLNSHEALRKPGSVGRAMDGVSLRILDGDKNPLPPGEIGEIYIRNDSFPEFTYHNMDEQKQTISEEGFVSLGDVGYLDKDGFLFLCDRARDMIISGGVNIYPAEIEAAIILMAGVKDCAVFGAPDPEYGEHVVAVIEPEDGVVLTDAAVRDYLSGKIAKYKSPRKVEFVTNLPREDSGKIMKRKLRDAYWKNENRAI